MDTYWDQLWADGFGTMVAIGYAITFIGCPLLLVALFALLDWKEVR